MPQLLRNSAAEGVSRGLDAHLRELDRTESQRQFDIGNLINASKNQADRLADLYSKLGPEALRTLQDPSDPTKSTTLSTLIKSAGDEQTRIASSSKRFIRKNQFDQPEPADTGETYNQYKYTPNRINLKKR